MLIGFLSIFVVVSQVQAACDVRDKFVNGLCYKISTSKLSYQDALNSCHKSNQYLALVDSPITANFIATWFSGQNGQNDFWIGLSRSNTSAAYQWDMGGVLSWSNFDSNYPNDGLMVAENTMNGKWHTVNGNSQLYYVCSYDPTTFPASTLLPVTVKPTPRPAVTCLFMVDSQSLGIDQKAVNRYSKFFHFAMKIGYKLAASADFSGYIDTFGYSDPNDHEYYLALDINAFDSLGYSVTTSNTEIDLDLEEVDSSLQMASWASPTYSTCLVFISAAPVEMYGGSSIKTRYPHFQTVVGAAIDGATIPGLNGAVAVAELNDNDAQAVANLLLETLPH